MTRLKRWLAISLLWAALMLQGQGQTVTEWLVKHPEGKPPESGILDEGKFLSRNPEAAQRISSQIRKLEQDHGYEVYLVIESVLIGTTAQEQANELRQLWLPEGNGLVIVFETDSRNLGIGQDMTGDPTERKNSKRVPSYETTAILNNAMTSVDRTLSSESYLEAVVGRIAAGFDAYFMRRETPPPPERSVRTALLVVGAVALLGLGAIAAGGLVRHSSMAKVRSFRFPVVDRPERLGAPCGGSVVTRRFSPPGPRS